MEKALTFTPHQRATRKCPSSWMNTTTVSTNRNGRRTDKMLQTPPSPCSKMAITGSLPRLSPTHICHFPLSERAANALSPASSTPRAVRPYPPPARHRDPGPPREGPPFRQVQRLCHKLGDLKEREAAGKECLHGHLVGGVEHGRCHPPPLHGLPCQAERLEPLLVGALEGQAAQLHEIDSPGRRRHAHGPAQAY